MSKKLSENPTKQKPPYHPSLSTESASSKASGGGGGDYHVPKALLLHKTDAQQVAGQYDLQETIGQGHFAVVKQARHLFTGEKVAIKVIDKTKLDDLSREHLFQEVRCMKLVQHPNVVRLYEVIDSPSKLYLILELGDGGDMYDYIMKYQNGLSEQMSKCYFRQIVQALKYCHDLHVVHRDLKPENVVFFEATGQVKLTDFGFSNTFEPGKKLLTSCGSLAYSAPEILLGDPYDAPPVDIWSLGVILYMLVTGRAPFQEANDSETLTMILDCKYYLPPMLSPECNDLISRMLVRDPDRRISLDDIIGHPWLESQATPRACGPKSRKKRSKLSSSSDNDDVLVGGTMPPPSSASQRRKKSSRSTSEEDEDEEEEGGEEEVYNNYAAEDYDDSFTVQLPLVKRRHLTEKQHTEILEAMTKGRIASQTEIAVALDDDKYNYITATYYLLAERLLKAQFQKRHKRKLNYNRFIKNAAVAAQQQQMREDLDSQRRKMTMMKSATGAAGKASVNPRRSSLVRQDADSHAVNELDEEEEDEAAEALEQEDARQKEKEQEAATLVAALTNTNAAAAGAVAGPLTNILEDEEEQLLDSALATPPLAAPTNRRSSSGNNLNAQLLNAAAAASVATSMPSTTLAGVSLSRRSSRSDNSVLATLTIPEEAESDITLSNNSPGTPAVAAAAAAALKATDATAKRRMSSPHRRRTKGSIDLDFEDISRKPPLMQRRALGDEDEDEEEDEDERRRILLAATKPLPTKKPSLSLTSSVEQQQQQQQLLGTQTTTSSDTSDNEMRSQQHLATGTASGQLTKQDMLLLNRSASASSAHGARSRHHRYHHHHLANIDTPQREVQRARPLSLSSETSSTTDEPGGGAGPNQMLPPPHSSAHHLVAPHLQQQQTLSPFRQSLSISTSNSNDHLAASFQNKTLSVEHRLANISQMSISSQLSKTNSMRHHGPTSSVAARTDTPVSGNLLPSSGAAAAAAHSSTPTPRESVVFGRGDDKPIAKLILLQQQKSIQQHHSSTNTLNGGEQSSAPGSQKGSGAALNGAGGGGGERQKSEPLVISSSADQLSERRKEPGGQQYRRMSTENENNKTNNLIKTKLDAAEHRRYNESYSKAIHQSNIATKNALLRDFDDEDSEANQLTVIPNKTTPTAAPLSSLYSNSTTTTTTNKVCNDVVTVVSLNSSKIPENGGGGNQLVQSSSKFSNNNDSNGLTPILEPSKKQQHQKLKQQQQQQQQQQQRSPEHAVTKATSPVMSSSNSGENLFQAKSTKTTSQQPNKTSLLNNSGNSSNNHNNTTSEPKNGSSSSSCAKCCVIL